VSHPQLDAVVDCWLSVVRFGSRKGQAIVVAVDERQQLESLIREEKTLARTVASAQARYEEFQARKIKLEEDNAMSGEKKAEVTTIHKHY
jgi:hypothetical protein